MTRREKLAVSLMRPMNPTVVVILGAYTVIWGLWLISPFWTVFTQAALYSAMAAISGELVWGLVAVCAGLVTCYGAYKPSYRNIRLGSFIAAIHWFVIALMYFMGDWHNTGGITSLTFAIYAGVIWVNTRVNRHLYAKDSE